jgi:uncharacterized protein (TIGR03067 family)
MHRIVVVVIALAALGAANQKEDAKEDKDKIQGKWAPTLVQRMGQKQSEEELKDRQVTFTADKLMVKRGETTTEMAYKLDATKKPKEIDVTLPNGSTGRGIYELSGDKLKILHGEEGGERPKSFDAAEFAKYNYGEFKRVK